jgi:hypothetical protein
MRETVGKKSFCVAKFCQFAMMLKKPVSYVVFNQIYIRQNHCCRRTDQ